MTINIPKTEGQKKFEEFAGVFVSVLARLTEDERTQVFNYMIFINNDTEGENK